MSNCCKSLYTIVEEEVTDDVMIIEGDARDAVWLGPDNTTWLCCAALNEAATQLRLSRSRD